MKQQKNGRRINRIEKKKKIKTKHGKSDGIRGKLDGKLRKNGRK